MEEDKDQQQLTQQEVRHQRASQGFSSNFHKRKKISLFFFYFSRKKKLNEKEKIIDLLS